MGIAIEATGADFSAIQVANPRFPDANGLVGEWLFGGSLAESSSNLADPTAAALTEIGSPSYGTGYATISKTTGFQTDFVGLDDMTAFVVALRDNLTQTIIPLAAPNEALASINSGFYYRRDTVDGSYVYKVRAMNDIGLADLEYPADSATNYILYATQMPYGLKGSVSAWTGGVRTTVESTVFGSTRTTQPWQMGGFNFGSGANGRIAHAAIFNRVLSVDEMDDAYTSIKSALALRGITVS